MTERLYKGKCCSKSLVQEVYIWCEMFLGLHLLVCRHRPNILPPWSDHSTKLVTLSGCVSFFRVSHSGHFFQSIWLPNPPGKSPFLHSTAVFLPFFLSFCPSPSLDAVYEFTAEWPKWVFGDQSEQMQNTNHSSTVANGMNLDNH